MDTYITQTIESIDPAAAERYMETAAANRHRCQRHISELAEDMAARRWDLNGTPIVFDWHGRLIDGQHRMLAIIRAGVPVRMAVVRGVDPDAFKTIDSGRKRSAADVFGTLGKKYRHELSGAVVFLYNYLNGSKVVRLNIHERLSTLKAHPGLEDSVAFCKSNIAHFPQTPLSVAHYLTSPHAAMRDGFFAAVATGVNLSVGAPALALRNAFVSHMTSDKKTPTHTLLGLTIKAFNAHARGVLIHKLALKDGEAFPRVVSPAATRAFAG